MRGWTTSARPILVISDGIVGRNNFSRLLNQLGLLAALVTLLTLIPNSLLAAKQKISRKEAPKSKSNPIPAPVHRLTNTPTHRALLLAPNPEPVDVSEKRVHSVYLVRGSETLSAVLNRFGVAQGDKQFWALSMRRSLGSEVLPAGKELHLYFSKPVFRSRGRGVAGQLKALELEQNDAYTLTMEKGIRGILFQRREKPFDVEIKTVSGLVQTSLFEDCKEAGLQPGLLSQLTDIFTWDVDLEKEVRPGDSYKILYEQRSRRGQESKPLLRILAAELLNAGQKFTAIYFEKQKGQGNYYNLEGRSLARSFLRFPLEFTSITSHFTDSRFHPILKTNLPHTGVDFAAQRGTPVRAVGDGVINEAGWNGSYGKAIDIKHDLTYMCRETVLNSCAVGVRSG